MVKIKIGEIEKEWSEVDEHWINQQINRRRADGLTVCVRVIVQKDDLNMILSTPACATSKMRGRTPRPREKELFDLWDKRGLNDADFTGGNLVAFLKQLKNIL